VPGPGWGYETARGRFAEARSAATRALWERVKLWGAVGPHSAFAKRFGAFGEGSIVMYPWNTLYGERWMRIGRNVMIGPEVTLSVGITPDQVPISDPVIVIGDGCLINKGTAIVAHFSVVIGNDVFTGHNCYITDQNHDYRDLTRPIGAQSMPEQPVRIGSGSWLGHGVVVLPGVTIGEHVTVAAGSVVTTDIPDRSVAVGSPARVVRRYDETHGWVSVPRPG
jgi:acetyltransferase-like isoleucine patch superfamily enzyme